MAQQEGRLFVEDLEQRELLEHFIALLLLAETRPPAELLAGNLTLSTHLAVSSEAAEHMQRLMSPEVREYLRGLSSAMGKLAWPMPRASWPLTSGGTSEARPVVKRSVSFGAEVWEQLAEAAEEEGVSVSALVSDTMGRALALRRAYKAVREWEAEHGELTDEEKAEADRELDAAFGNARLDAPS